MIQSSSLFIVLLMKAFSINCAKLAWGFMSSYRKRYKVNIKYHKKYMNNAGWKI